MYNGSRKLQVQKNEDRTSLMEWEIRSGDLCFANSSI